jgi:endonuclease/exonuclease/phosphatase family metal-dependent hydrolase
VEGQLDVVTANILYTLGNADARASLHEVLAAAPDLVGLQEWGASRYELLRETGRVGPVPHTGKHHDAKDLGPASGYLWNAPLLGGCAVGARADRFTLLECRPRLLSPVQHADRPDRWLGVEPPRVATVAVYEERDADRTVCLVDYHLTPGVQARGRYRDERPVLAERHRREVRALEGIVSAQLALGRVVLAVGDSNFDGLRLTGLTSAWEGREGEPGTLGPRRKVDDVHGPGRAASVTLLATASDHKAVLVRRTL